MEATPRIGATPRFGIPYPVPTDAVTDYPTTGRSLAELLDAKVGATCLFDSIEAGITLPAFAIGTPSLPQTFKHLLVSWIAMSDRPGAVAARNAIRFNSAGSPDYYYSFVYGGIGGAVGSEARNAYGAYIGDMAAGAAASSLNRGYGLTLIPHYTDQGWPRWLSLNGLDYSPASNSFVTLMASGFFGGLGASGSLLFLSLDGSNYITGTRITVYGLN